MILWRNVNQGRRARVSDGGVRGLFGKMALSLAEWCEGETCTKWVPGGKVGALMNAGSEEGVHPREMWD